MSTRHLVVLALVCASTLVGCARGGGRRSGIVPVPHPEDAGTLPPADGAPRDAAHGPDAVVVPFSDAGRPIDTHHDAAASYPDAGHVDAAAPPRVDAGAGPVDAAVDAPWPMFDVGTDDVHTVAGATRCWQSQAVLASGVFVGTTCGAIDLVGASCGHPGAPERYFTAFGPPAGGQASYFIQIDPPEFVIQELVPTEVGFDCWIMDGACSAGRRMLVTEDITQFSIERGTGGCGEFTMTVGAM